MSGLEYLIVNERDLSQIDRFLKNHSKVLENKNIDGDNVLMLLLKLYISLSEDATSEIDYYYNVIFLFKSRFYDSILNNIDSYLNIINKYNVKDRKHVIKLTKLFDNNYLTTFSDLEYKYNVSFSFNDSIINEMYSFIFNNNHRYNFTNQESITIDNSNAICLDDAIYLENNNNGTYTLYIHITDIASFIPYDSLVSRDAMKREETLYLIDRVISMYPEYICDNICSLLPNNNRNVISLIVLVDNNFNIMEDTFKIVKGKINVKHKLSYNECDAKIFNPDNSNISNMLINLFRISINRRKVNKKKDLYRNYENMIKRRSYHESLNIDISPASNIVHEMMILLNYLIASYFKDNSYPFIYREVFLPDDEFMKKQLEIAKNISNDGVDNKDFIYSIRGAYIEWVYVDNPKYHMGLKLDCYSHLSCPARRYADSFCEYLIYDFIFNEKKDNENIYLWESRIKQIITYLNRRKKENEMMVKEYNYLVKKRLIR